MSEVPLSTAVTLTHTFRIDAEFFQRKSLEADSLLTKQLTHRLADVTSKIDVGFVGSMTAHYRDEGVSLLQTKNIAPFFVDDADTVWITEAFHSALHKSQIKFKDILIARSGSFGKAAIYLQTKAINSSDIIIIKADEKKINPYFLTAFLNSSWGADQMIRFASGGVQGHVNLTILEELKVPSLDDQFQTRIETSIWKAHELLEKGKSVYLSAENHLKDFLGLVDFVSPEQNVGICAFRKSFGITGRLDAEHYQPKYEALHKALAASNKIFRLGDRLSFNQRGSQPDYADTGLQVINSKHVQRGEVLIDDTRFAVLQDKDNAVFIEQGDVLINGTGVGTIGRAAPYLHKQRALPDNHVTVLRTDAMSPICLALYLNSIAGQMQVDQHFKGSSGQIELYPADIANFWCPEIDKVTQRKIDALAQSSFELKAKSERLLEAAKRAVEIAIEHDEAAGMAYLARANSTELGV